MKKIISHDMEMSRVLDRFSSRELLFFSSGIISILLGGSVLIGWLTGQVALIQVDPSFVPMQFNTALGFVISGFCVVLYRDYFKLAKVVSLILIILSSLTLSQYIFKMNLGIDELLMDHYITVKSSHPGRMAPTTATSFFVFGLLHFLGRFDYFKFNAGVVFRWLLNSFLFSLGVLAFAGYILGTEETFQWQAYTQMAIHTSFGFIILSLGGFSYLSLSGGKSHSLFWLPIPVSTIILLIFLVIGALLRREQNENLEFAVGVDGKLLESKIIQKLKLDIKAFERLSSRIIYRGEVDKNFWLKDTDHYIKDFGYYDAFYLSDRMGKVILSTPDNAKKTEFFVERKVARLLINTKEGKTYISSSVNVNGQRYIFWSYPLYKNENGKKQYFGESIALVSIDKLFSKFSQNIGITGFTFKIVEEGKTIFDSNKDQREISLKGYIRDKLSSDLGGWEIEVYALRSVIQKIKTQTPEIVIGIGILLAILSGLVTFYFQRLRILRKKALSAEKSKAMFLANMSHEIRTPMNAIMGMTRLLKFELKDSEYAEQVNIIDDSSKSLLTILNDILDITKIEAGKLSITREEFELKQFIESISQFFRIEAEKKGLKLKYEIQDGCPLNIITDEVRLRQVISNLVSNAIKFTDEGQIDIKVGFRNIDDHRVILKFDIKDTGIGIPEDSFNDIFKEFSQVENYSTRRHGGTGLGLSISRKIVNLLGGEIHVRSRVGHGSTLSFEIYAKYNEKQNSEATDKSAEKTQVGHEELRSEARVLVVDDNKINLKVAQQFLKKLGHESDAVLSGEEALSLIETHRYDIIFMDCHMPKLDGFETTEKIIAKLGDQKPYIIALTASTMKEDVDRCYAVGMDYFLAKPLSLEELRVALEKAYSKQNT